MKNITIKEREVAMKKVLTIMFMVMVLLCGCQVSNEESALSEYYTELAKAQEISVIPAHTSTATDTLTSSEDIANFISALDMDSWEMKSLPETAELAGMFSLSQEDTIKFGEAATDGELHQVCEVSCYKNAPYITLKMLDLNLTFEVSDATAEYLNSYFA